MLIEIHNDNIHVDKIESIYLKDKEGNVVELFKGKDFNYDYSCNSHGNKKLNIRCDMSDKSVYNTITTSATITTPTPLPLEGWSIPNNTFDRAYGHAHSCITEGYSCHAEGYDHSADVNLSK